MRLDGRDRGLISQNGVDIRSVTRYLEGERGRYNRRNTKQGKNVRGVGHSPFLLVRFGNYNVYCQLPNYFRAWKSPPL